MSIDYDAPRTGEDHEVPEGLAGLRSQVLTSRVFAEEEFDQPMDLLGAELEGSALLVPVLPRQSDEFVCARCFLIHHRSRVAGGTVCADCA
ncbi:MAG TPA: DUF4193 family protein [Sporichthyaceae bacterium]|jgi:hypothetical protein|nr:DUF4193 family protein [Sporichthyaceae bacterium]